jgi:hypothetical protein
LLFLLVSVGVPNAALVAASLPIPGGGAQIMNAIIGTEMIDETIYCFSKTQD